MQSIPLLDPRRDAVFKTIFSKETKESSTARNSIISAFIGRKIQSSTVLNPELTIEDVRDKAARLDILCVLPAGTGNNQESLHYVPTLSINNCNGRQKEKPTNHYTTSANRLMTLFGTLITLQTAGDAVVKPVLYRKNKLKMEY
jgi:hypothetical protein